VRVAPVCLVLALLLAVRLAAEEPKRARYEPTSNYVLRNIQGWHVYVNRCLLGDQKELGRKTLELLRVKLYDINREVPERALVRLHKIPIWVEYKHPGHPCACYHPDIQWLRSHGYNPEKAGSVEIANAEAFLRWTHQQPWMVLHELAHGYHHLFLGGYSNVEIAAAYQRAVAAKSYEQVLHYDNKKVRAYALQNPQEYFAELSEAWFGTNDFYPFVRAEVIRHDPEMAGLLKKLWGK